MIILSILGTNPQQGTENRNPLPNPWGPPSTGSGSAPRTTGSAPNSAGVGATPGVLNSPAMQSLMQQMSEQPQLMQNFMSAPYTRAMFEAMSADPNLASNVIFTTNY